MGQKISIRFYRIKVSDEIIIYYMESMTICSLETHLKNVMQFKVDNYHKAKLKLFECWQANKFRVVWVLVRVQHLVEIKALVTLIFAP